MFSVSNLQFQPAVSKDNPHCLFKQVTGEDTVPHSLPQGMVAWPGLAKQLNYREPVETADVGSVNSSKLRLFFFLKEK